MDADNAVDDLHRLITAAGLSRPIVLVGHSISRNMVLIDPAFRGSDDPYVDRLERAKAVEILAG